MGNGIYIKYDALTKIEDPKEFTDTLRLILGNEKDNKNYDLTDIEFVEMLKAKGLIPNWSITEGGGGDTITNISFDSSTSELVVTTDKGTYNVPLQQYYKVDNLTQRDNLIPSPETSFIGAQLYVSNTSNDILDPQPKTYRYDGNGNWVIIGEGSNNFQLDGTKPITRSGDYKGLVVGGSTTTEVLRNFLYPSEPPTVNLNGGGIIQYGSSLSRSVSYSIIKRTYGIVSASLIQGPDTTSISISTDIDEDSDNNPSDQNGVLSVTLNSISSPSSSVQNSETFTLSALDNQGTSVSNNTSFTFRHKRYWGKINSDGDGNTYTVLNDITSNPPTDAKLLTLSSELSTSRVKTYNGINGAGEFLIFAFPTLFGTPSFVVNGLPNTAFTKIKSASNFTNSDGFVQPYDVWVSNTPQNSALNIQIN